MNGKQLRAWRKSQFLRQSDLAALLNVTTHAVANWECGRARVPGPVEPALEGITQQRATLVRKLRLAKEELAHRRALKMIAQHPEAYKPQAANAAKARAVLADQVASRKKKTG